MHKKIKMNILIFLGAIIVIYFLVALTIYLSQDKLLYHPEENNYLDKNKLNHENTKVTILSENNLVGWYYKKNENYKTLLFFHGNAGRLENRIYKLNEISKLDLNYLIFAYRGFSGNKGIPNEKGIYEDSQAAQDWLNSIGIKNDQIILYGESLGTAVAINLAKDTKFAGVILESPFTSMVDLAQKNYPYLPAKILLKDQYETIKKLKKVNSPILVMHGKKDNIVPFSMGLEVYKNLKEPKYKYFNDYDDHMLDFNKDLVNSIKFFIQSLN